MSGCGGEGIRAVSEEVLGELLGGHDCDRLYTIRGKGMKGRTR